MTRFQTSNLQDLEVMTSSTQFNRSLLGLQFIPDAEEVKNMYLDKPVAQIVATLLDNLVSPLTVNKNEHMNQFFQLYRQQRFRMKTEFRKLLFLGSRPLKIVGTRHSSEEEKKQSDFKLGIISLLPLFIDDEKDSNQMQADNLLNFIFDLLDHTKSPQAEAFNFLFNNMDVYYVFKMKLPHFIAVNSPFKSKAMKLLHQYIVNTLTDSK